MGIFSDPGKTSFTHHELPIAQRPDVSELPRRGSVFPILDANRKRSLVPETELPPPPRRGSIFPGNEPMPTRRGSSIASTSAPTAPPRKGSIFHSLRSFGLASASAEPEQGFVVSQQPSFLGRKQSTALVPAVIRKDVLHQAETDRDPTHLRMGESEHQQVESMETAFFKSRLTMDAPSDDEEPVELDEKFPDRPNVGSGRGSWSTMLGWDVTGVSRGHHGKKHKKKKRKMRELDTHLDMYNSYSQNGLTPLTRTPTRGSLKSSLKSGNQSMTSLNGKALSNAASLHDLDIEDKPAAVPVGDGFDALDVMADHIFRIGVQRKKWFKAPRLGAHRDDVATGVSIRAKTGLYRTFPVNYEPLFEFEEAVSRLNPEIAIKIDSQIVRNVFRTYIDPFETVSELTIDENTRIQILDEMQHVARARKHQYAAFVRDEGVLVVWADVVENIIPAAEALEEALIQFIWRGEEENKKVNQAILLEEEAKIEQELAEKEGSVREEDLDPEDLEMRKTKKRWRERPVMLFAPVSDGLAIILCMSIISLGLRTLIKEWALDGLAWRFSLFVFSPLLFWVASFACMCIISSIMQIIGPIRQCTQKSTYFSGVAPKRTMGELAHVTVQMPVYKESLKEVIRPTIESLKKAITTYERQGGSVGILICDDGLQLLSQEEADKRRQFYFDNNIAYVARPGHNVDGFVRKGRFKKAGNMNYANALSLRVEEIMDDLRVPIRAELPEDHFWSDSDENGVYDKALAMVLEERNGTAWAAGNIRFGSIILLIDSDTRVPEDCFADAVSEMAESPEVAIIQHTSGVMQVAHHFFENAVAHFTKSIQVSIGYCCASGEVAPFVGHNAFLRWSALQECMFLDPDDGVMKIWSEDHVSEDFQIAVTLQIKGYVVRWVTYSGGEFEEGVSLTCDDELNRWQKYAYGCSELLFHPLKNWWRRGPFTPLIRQFVWSGIPLHSKFTIFGYIFSYYAIGCAWALTLLNFFLVGWNIVVDGYYVPSWYITLVCIALFIGLMNVAFVVLRYRLKMPDTGKLSLDQMIWIPFFNIFFIGLSMPVSLALVSHLVGYNMTWSTTVKTVERSNFFLQIPIIWKRFWVQLIVFTLFMAMMIVMSTNLLPTGYRVNGIEVMVPMGFMVGAHLLWPFALNPWFLSFSLVYLFLGLWDTL